MRAKTLSILSLLLLACLVAGCSGGSGGGKTETFTLRKKKVTFTAPASSWKRTERKTEPGADGSMKDSETIAIEFTPPLEKDEKPEDAGYLLISNLGVSDVKDRAEELHSIIALLKSKGASQEVYNRILRQLDESGNAGLLEYVDEKTGKVSSEKSSELHEELDAAARALNVPKGSQPKVKEALPHLEKAAKLCDEGWKKKEVDLVETGRILNAVDKRRGQVTAKEEITIDGQRAAWIEYEVEDERGIHALFIKDNSLYSIALSVPSKRFSEGKAATRAVVDSFKVQ